MDKLWTGQLSVSEAGPLQPCILIVLLSKENGAVLAFHMHWMNSLLSLKRMVDAEPRLKDRTKVHGMLVSFHHQGAEETLSKVIPNWSQQNEFLRINKFLENELKLNKTLIVNTLFEKPAGLSLGQHALLYSGYTAIDKEGNFFSIDPFTNDILGLSEDVIDTKNPKTGEIKKQKHSQLTTADQIQYFMQIDKLQQEEMVRTHLGLKKTDALSWQAKPGEHAIKRGTVHFFMLNDKAIIKKPSLSSEAKE